MISGASSGKIQTISRHASHTLKALISNGRGTVNILRLNIAAHANGTILSMLVRRHQRESQEYSHLLHSLCRSVQPRESPSRQLELISGQAVHHDHEHIRSDRSKEVPPSMHLEKESPWHPNGSFESCQLRAEDAVKLPEEVAESHVRCKRISIIALQY
jgi:hypothetical protein